MYPNPTASVGLPVTLWQLLAGRASLVASPQGGFRADVLDLSGEARTRAAAAPVPGPPAAPFVSQLPSPSNPNEDVRRNANCGPTCVLMAAMAFGLTAPTPAQVDGALEDVRRRAGAPREERAGHGAATSFPQLSRALASFGLDARRQARAELADVEAHLAAGRLVIALVKPGHYTRSASTGHYVLVTRVAGGKVHLNDPGKRGGPIVVDAAAFGRAMKAKDGAILAVGP